MAASKKSFLRAFQSLAVVCVASFACGQSPGAQQAPRPETQQYVVTKIFFDGNRRVQRDTLLGRIYMRPGDPYTAEGVRRDFMTLWNTQFFEDIRLEVEDDPDRADGKILVYHVQERPIVRRIQYKGNKSVSESDILDAFKQRKVGLSVESQFDPTKIKRAEVILKELLASHGRQFASVKPTYERIAATNAVNLTFNIEEGPKVKVGKITFQGNKAFSNGKLLRSMKHDRPISIPLGITYIPIMSKTFDRPKLDEDLEVGVRGLYQDHGYFRVDVNVGSLKTVDVNRGGIPGPWPLVGAKHGKATDIVVTIDEGAQFRMGTLLFRSSDPDEGLVFKPEFLQRVFPLKEGDIFSAGLIRKSLDTYRKLYGEYGYIDFTAVPLFDMNDAKKTVNLTLQLDQQKQYFVRRIEFSGNTTRDKVIRRELLIDEGQIFNNRYWELSLLRLNQLGYFETIKPENAEMKRNVKAGTVDIRLKVKEKGKQQISFSGGVSGSTGSFIGFSYQTNNFLGRGETLSIAAQVGSIQRNIQFGYTQPYLFDRPISSGFTVFASKLKYNTATQQGLIYGRPVAVNPQLQQNYNTDSAGFTVFSSYPLRKLSFTRIGMSYAWSTTDITALSQSATLLFELTRYRSLAGPDALKGIRISQITPTLQYNTVDNPVFPTHGKSIYYGVGVAGGPIGGNVNMITSNFEFAYYRPTYHGRNVIALKFRTNALTGFGGLGAPVNSRYFLGGEQDVRGYDFYTISPFVFIPYATTTNVTYTNPGQLDQNGKPIQQAVQANVLEYVPNRPGGDLVGLFNAEYRIPLVGSYLSMSLFNDLGINGIMRRSGLQLDPSAVAVLQGQYPNPDFPNLTILPGLRVAPGTSFRPHTSAGVEFVFQIPIIQAPFRIYYATNYLRMNRTITPPLGAFSFDPVQREYLIRLGVYDTQIVPQLENFLTRTQATQTIPPNLLESGRVLRFAVSRTF